MQELNLNEIAQIVGGLFHVVLDSSYTVARDIKPEN